MLYYKGSSRQLRKLRYQLLKMGFENSSLETRYRPETHTIALFKHTKRFVLVDWNTDQQPVRTYKGRQYKQALQALNIPV